MFPIIRDILFYPEKVIVVKTAGEYRKKMKNSNKNKTLKNKFNFESPDEDSDSYTARNFSVSYLRHLFVSDEILAAQLATIHNLRFYIKLLEDAREAIKRNRFTEFKKTFLEKFRTNT